ncbi:MAG: divergent PAP2 family protein [Candidatus Pacebacteria bacterium]|nr:divergent PAP2 family protein [Candidatus Paceibacterota bacterium]
MIYPTVIIPIIVGCVTQSIKFLLSIIKHKRIDLKFLLISGHMPSAHSAFVVSLATVIAFFDGVFSTTFTVSFVLAYIVIYDALKIRTNIGYNGEIINKLVREIPEIKKEDYPILRERVGHRPMEVLAGSVLGFILTIFLIILFGIL